MFEFVCGFGLCLKCSASAKSHVEYLICQFKLYKKLEKPKLWLCILIYNVYVANTANLVDVVWLESNTTQCVTKREWLGFKWERL